MPWKSKAVSWRMGPSEARAVCLRSIVCVRGCMAVRGGFVSVEKMGCLVVLNLLKRCLCFGLVESFFNARGMLPTTGEESSRRSFVISSSRSERFSAIYSSSGKEGDSGAGDGPVERPRI